MKWDEEVVEGRRRRKKRKREKVRRVKVPLVW